VSVLVPTSVVPSTLVSAVESRSRSGESKDEEVFTMKKIITKSNKSQLDNEINIRAPEYMGFQLLLFKT
jgi:hypothetical protein